MGAFAFSRHAVRIGAAALFAGCGGSQPAIGAPRVTLQSRAITKRADHGGPLSAHPRIFFSAIDNGDQDRIFILTYPGGDYVTEVQGVAGSGLCTDYRGNVWVAEYGNYAEVTYDGQLVGVHTNPYVQAYSCAVDRKSDTLALTSISNGNVLLGGTLYATGLSAAYFCTFDGSGDLFVTGMNGQQPELVELPKGSTSFKSVPIDQPIDGPHAIAWDGHFLTLEAALGRHRITLYRLQIVSGQAEVIGKSYLEAPYYRFWTQGYEFGLLGHTIVQSSGSNTKHVDFWRYPSGGRPFRKRRWPGRGIYHIGALTIDIP